MNYLLRLIIHLIWIIYLFQTSGKPNLIKPFITHKFLSQKFLGAINCNINQTQPEAVLLKSLFCNGSYDTNVRPNLYTLEQFHAVHVQLKLLKTNYDEENNMLTINTWLFGNWPDQRVNWKFQKNRIYSAFVDKEHLWLPDLMLPHSYMASGQQICIPDTYACYVLRFGYVKCTIQCSFTAFCTADFRRWPFDKQMCTLAIDDVLLPDSVVKYYIHNQTEADYSDVDKKIGRQFIYSSSRYKSDSRWIVNVFEIDRHVGIDIIVVLSPIFGKLIKIIRIV